MACIGWKCGVLGAIIVAALIAWFNGPEAPLYVPTNAYWGPKTIPDGSPPPKDDESIEKFSVEYDASLIARLRDEISNSKWVPPLQNSAYTDGINLKTFQDVMEYWKTKFDFGKSLKEINAHPHFKTEIEGLKIHFIRSPAKPRAANVKVIPLMLVHGWPGSFHEFLKSIPLLNEVENNVAFDIVVPSLPGYGFSEAPSKHGVDAVVTARIFKKLMARLGYSRYFVQGGDWGSVVTAAMGSLYPEEVRGIHLNLLYAGPTSLRLILKQVIFNAFPSVFGDGPLPPCVRASFREKISFIWRESGYYHIQATKPDTIGFALLNSPVGLAAYIMEKFSTGTNVDYRELDDGGLGKTISIDDVLSNVMIYYATNSIVSAVRFYRENVLSGNAFKIYRHPITVPTGYTIFPNEISCSPKFIASELLSNLTTLTYQPSGGHFAAFEETKAFVADIRQYVKKVLEMYPENS